MKNKYLYQFTVPKIENTEVQETRVENGEEIKITKKEKKIVEKKFGLLSPKRSKIEEGEMYYASKVSENIKNGILPTAILIRKFDEQGGFLSDSELKYQNSLRDDSIEISRKIQELTTENKTIASEKIKAENNEKIDILIDQYYALQEELVKIQQTVDAFFEQSAEIKARNKTIIWWILNLAYDLNDDKEEFFFRGKTLEDKLNSLDDLEESNEEYLGYMVKKFSYLTSYWFGTKINKEDQFKEAEKNFRLITGVKEYDQSIADVKDREAKVNEETLKAKELKAKEEETAAAKVKEAAGVAAAAAVDTAAKAKEAKEAKEVEAAAAKVAADASNKTE